MFWVPTKAKAPHSIYPHAAPFCSNLLPLARVLLSAGALGACDAKGEGANGDSAGGSSAAAGGGGDAGTKVVANAFFFPVPPPRIDPDAGTRTPIK